MFTGALFTWPKHGNNLSVYPWMNGLKIYIQWNIIQPYKIIKPYKMEILPWMTTWMKLEGIM